MVNKKSPWLAAIFNFLLPGLGYIYSGKRVFFGAGILIVSVLLYWGISFQDLPLIVWVDSLLMAFLFAFDGYQTAEEVNKSNKK